ncbi:universal stress protein [Streptomyces viridosporus]|uniref:universal stress protein n=1 Tax=Streptomyces viridosporus TaxID=67581 RepID=UPI000311673D|nr:universal stress protein [Streptomyces viridosporus]
MAQPVLAGVDGSAESLAAAQWAAREAVRRDRPLRLLHARSPYPRGGGGGSASAARRHLARRLLREAEDRIRATCPDVRLFDEQVEGPATEALVEAARQAELLVLGSRGLSAFTGFLLGSVSRGVVARTTRPVVLVRAGGEAADGHLTPSDGPPAARTGRRDVVLGLDVTEPCDEVVGFAFEAARSRGARLRAVHAWRAPGTLGPGPGGTGPVDGAHRAEEWLGFLSAVLRVWRDKYPDVRVVETVAEGRPGTVLVKAASGAGLLVVGHRTPGRPPVRRAGPVTHAVVHRADCAVAVVPHT